MPKAQAYLLNRRADARVEIPLRQFTTLSSVRPGTNGVHGLCQGAVRLRGNRSEGHGAGGELLDDLCSRLHQIDGDRFIGETEVKLAAEGAVTRADVRGLGELAEGLLAVVASGGLE